MEFFIKQNATLPTLKLELIQNGRSDFQLLSKLMETDSIFMSMVDEKTKLPKIVGAPCEIIPRDLIDSPSPEYYINYQFRPRETKKIGRYKCSFYLRDSSGDTILPLTEDLYVNIVESDILIDSCCK